MGKHLAESKLGAALRTHRKGRGLSQSKLARRAGIAERTLWHLEQGEGGLKSFTAALDALDLALFCRNAAGGTLSELILTLRRRRGVSQEELARLAGVTRPTIRELGRNGRGRLATLERVLHVLGAGPYLAEKGHKKAFYATAGNSSVSETWRTPQELLLALYRVFKFDLDPCSPTKKGPVKARVHYTEEDDGLSLPWHGAVYVNPPYGRTLAEWVEKARREHVEGRARVVVLLIPARTDTAYWHDHVTTAEVWFLRGRLRFNDGPAAAPFPSALAVWGANPEEVAGLDEVLPGSRS